MSNDRFYASRRDHWSLGLGHSLDIGHWSSVIQSPFPILKRGHELVRLAAMRILSGIQPSGALHIGNYFGMMRPAIELQEKGEAFYFIANYHSMTSLTDASERRKNSLDIALDFLACGLDPKKSVFWKQSDVPEVTELAWLLSTVTPMGLLERCHSYKDKKARLAGDDVDQVNHGLFAYPVLMAADILAFDSNIVPVGKDQKQHVEVTRDIAIKF